MVEMVLTKPLEGHASGLSRVKRCSRPLESPIKRLHPKRRLIRRQCSFQAVAQASTLSDQVSEAQHSETPSLSVAPSEQRRRITGNTVVITGGSQGVGRATALLFARNGYNVVIAARNQEKLTAAAAELSSAVSSSRSVSALSTDITDESAVKQLVEDVTDTYASVNILINCAGVCLNGGLSDTSLSDYVEQMNVNFFGAVAVTKGFQAALIKAAASADQRRPVVVNVNSFGGRIPLRNMAAYTASKFALAGFTDAIRPEFADLGIHVAQVHPGVVKSNFMERAAWRGPKGDQQRATMERMLASPPPGLVQTPEEVAQQIYNAAVNYKEEVFVGPAYNIINALFRSTNVNPFSVAPPQ